MSNKMCLFFLPLSEGPIRKKAMLVTFYQCQWPLPWLDTNDCLYQTVFGINNKRVELSWWAWLDYRSFPQSTVKLHYNTFFFNWIFQALTSLQSFFALTRTIFLDHILHLPENPNVLFSHVRISPQTRSFLSVNHQCFRSEMMVNFKTPTEKWKWGA